MGYSPKTGCVWGFTRVNTNCGFGGFTRVNTNCGFGGFTRVNTNCGFRDKMMAYCWNIRSLSVLVIDDF